MAKPSGISHEFPLSLFSAGAIDCSPLRPGKGHPIRDTDAMVVIDTTGNITLFTAANSDQKGANWEAAVEHSVTNANTSKEILANLCHTSSASLFDVFSQVLKPLLGHREKSAALDDPCGILDALDSRTMELPSSPLELEHVCNYLRQMHSAASYLERSADQLGKTMEALRTGGWVRPEALSVSTTLVDRVTTGLRSIQTKADEACSRLDGKQSDLREQASTQRDHFSNLLAGAGLALAAFPLLGNYLPATFAGWLSEVIPYLSGAGIASLGVAYLLLSRKQRVKPNS